MTTSTPITGERAARIVLGVWALLWAANDSLPYLGGRDDSCQTMFSSLAWGRTAEGRSWNNHLLVPQHMVFDQWVVLELRDVRIEGDARDGRERALFRWLRDETRLKSIGAVRAALWQLCDGHRVSLSFREQGTDLDLSFREQGTDLDLPWRERADVCEDDDLATLSWWIPVRLYESDFPLPVAPPEEP